MLGIERVRVNLYTGPHCELCEQALIILEQSTVSSELEIVMCNIRQQHDWYHRYAVRIPVVQRQDNGQELGWPFNQHELEQFLA